MSSLNLREDILSVGFDTWYGIVLMVIGVGILAPIAEELFFRGLLYDWFRQKTGVVWGMVISSLLFGFAHYDSLAVVGSSFVMGLAMALAVEKTRSLWIAIFMHVTTNTGAVIMMAVLTQLQDLLPQSLQY
jgi:membrane protease YdiL (CAAX protease family)